MITEGINLMCLKCLKKTILWVVYVYNLDCRYVLSPNFVIF